MTKNTPGLRALLWVAVSTTAQASDDKASLPIQESDQRTICEREGWRIVDVLKVPGHSRHYIDIHKMASDARKEGIDAFDRLLSHFAACDFDILVCRDSERFARSQSLHGYVVESVVLECRARIYSLADGWIDTNNFRMFIAMAGYKAASDIDRLIKAHKYGMDKRAEMGLPISSRVIRSHRVVRNEAGKAIATVVNEDKAPLVEATALLLLEGVSWDDIEAELYRRFGFVDDDGSKLVAHAMYHTFHTPTFWGHTARYWKKHRARFTYWIWDAGEPPPADVKMFRDTHPPALSGDLAERVKAEMTRRHLVMKGKARPTTARRFTGLLLCDDCGYYLAYTDNKGFPSYRCMSKWNRTDHIECNNNGSIPEPRVMEWLSAKLKQRFESADDALFSVAEESSGIERMLDNARSELADAEQIVRRLLMQQARSVVELSDIYDEQINEIAERRRYLKTLVTQLEHQVNRHVNAQPPAIETIKTIGLPRFWDLPEAEVNQLLHESLGKTRLRVMNREIVRIGSAPPRKRERRVKRN